MAGFFDTNARKEAAAVNRSSKKPTKDTTRLQPWVEKYRPKSLDEVKAQGHTISVLQRTLQASNLPHMLYYGPPGTGKTSTILALAKELYGPELYRTRVLELNASDERGISIVRSKIKDFARIQLSQASADHRSRYPCPPYKIIILDEADSMTQDAQSALRRTMETYSKITRFCLICNYASRIIDPLASRCSKFRFKMMESCGAKMRIEEIAANEGVQLGDGASETLVRCAGGDLRKAITYLQSAARLVGATQPPQQESDEHAMQIDSEDGTTRAISAKNIEDLAGIIPEEMIQRLVTAIQPKSKGAVYASVAQVVTDLIAEGWSGMQIVSQLFSVLIEAMIDDIQKNKITLIFSEVDKRLVDGSDEHLTILDLALQIANVLSVNAS